MSKKVSSEKKELVHQRDRGICCYCGRKVYRNRLEGHLTKYNRATIDHFISRSNKITDLVVACEPCNSEKGGRQLSVWLKFLSEERNIDIEGVRRELRNRRRRKV